MVLSWRSETDHVCVVVIYDIFCFNIDIYLSISWTSFYYAIHFVDYNELNTCCINMYCTAYCTLITDICFTIFSQNKLKFYWINKLELFVIHVKYTVQM